MTGTHSSAGTKPPTEPGQKDIVFRPIGFVRSPYTSLTEVPRQGALKPQATAWLELLPEFAEGARDITVGSSALVLFHFDRHHDYDLVTIARKTGEVKGVFSTRSPRRPNGIGASVVRFTTVLPGRLEFTGVDMVEGTPVLDIKPMDSPPPELP
ncbi:MAG: tRNA (N6-threonylcarbamoyladenosine(37)-N6)-methyltransferase TrmO [Brooklawnia sp.]